MLGFYLFLYRQQVGRESPARFDSKEGARLASWTEPFDGLDWIDVLVKENKITDLGGDGYPFRYTGTCEILKSHLPPNLPARHSFNQGIEAEELEACAPGEWLLLEVWDKD